MAYIGVIQVNVSFYSLEIAFYGKIPEFISCVRHKSVR